MAGEYYFQDQSGDKLRNLIMALYNGQIGEQELLWPNATAPVGGNGSPYAGPTYMGEGEPNPAVYDVPQGNPIAQTGGQVGGMAAGHYAANQLAGGGSTPGVPNLISAQFAPNASSAVTATEQALGIGAADPSIAAINQSSALPGTPQLAEALHTGSPWTSNVGGWGTIAPPLAAALIGGYTLNKGKDAWENSQYSSGNPITGLKEGIEAAGPLNFVPVLGQLPWLAGAAGAMFGSGKDKAQHGRDVVREKLIEGGFLNPDYTLDLADGSMFDIGKDGNARLTNKGVDPLTGQDWRHQYDVDWSDPEIGGIVAAINPLAAFFAGGDKKLTSDFAGYLTNAATSSGNPLKNIMHLIGKAGLDHDKLYGGIHLLSKSQGGPLEDHLADAYKNALDQLYGVGAYKGKGQQFGTPDISPGQKPVVINNAQSASPSTQQQASAPAATPQVVATPQASSPKPAIKPQASVMQALGNAVSAGTKAPDKTKLRGIVGKR